MARVLAFTTEQHDPYFNLALEDWLFRNLDPKTEVLFLWRNRPCVVIGRFQNPWEECRLRAMEQDGVVLARRQSGGGAVYHDLGNMNFTFISPRNTYNRQRNFTIILDALKACGISAVLSSRNDILIQGKKVSGSAFRIAQTRAFHHGTLLINADIANIVRYLTPEKKKFVSQGIRSTASTVANISDFHPLVTHETVCKALLESFFACYQDRCPIEVLTVEQFSGKGQLDASYRRYTSWEWLFGSTPPFFHHLSCRFDWGNLTMDFSVDKGLVDQVTVSSDALPISAIQRLQERLWAIPYTAQAIAETFATCLLKETQKMGDDIATFVLQELG